MVAKICIQNLTGIRNSKEKLIDWEQGLNC